MQKTFSVAELARNLGLEVSTAHRRIQLAVSLGFIEVEKKGVRVKYSQKDLLVLKILDEAYRVVSSDARLIELLTPKKPADIPEDGVGNLIATVVNVTNEMLQQYAAVSYALEKLDETNGVLSRKLSNVQDKLDALWRKIDRLENPPERNFQ
ncbi:helix-turn-helix transcriptional regulator [Paenibacillus frigoriresistens]|uniref:helix-turn-helix domain-containing protein n=1 Tax=Paenibacillus alginolyticus TaxID=59839 RepID=UPI0015657A0C|nr:helix-turn-helix domain-containing protein [Paenibacillus frigoriresistens]NRF93622.1 helix-turn-helix transcriptional regulator [Paenibacillus frigoriresistens]